MSSSVKPFTPDEIARIRTKANQLFDGLDTKPTSSRSWIQAGKAIVPDKDTRSPKCQYFDTHGFLKVSQFADKAEVTALIQQMKSLSNEWDPASGIESFGTNTKENKIRGDYFLESANKVHFFAETTALSEDKQLKPEYTNDKMSALNKAGHAMHMVPGAFRDYALSDKIRNLVLELGWQDPVVPQSMYIFKQAKIGGTVTSHQDSTFLYTEPKQSCLGLWLALHDATLDNGCLWVRPGSHRESTRRHYKRNPLHFGNDSIETRSNEALGETTANKFVMEELDNSGFTSVPWDGEIPQGDCDALFEAGFIPIECKAGDLLTFNGQLDHLSLPNFSDKPRHTFQLHLVEGEKAGVTWSKFNWLQYPPDVPFMRLLEDQK